MILGLTLAWVVILVGCWLGWQLLRQNGRLLLRLDELEKRLDELEFGEGEEPEQLPVGIEAPAFELPDLAGDPKSLAQYKGNPVLLIFFRWRALTRPTARPAVISSMPKAGSPADWRWARSFTGAGDN